MPRSITWTWTISAPPDGERADLLLQTALHEKLGSVDGALPSVTRSGLKRLIESGNVTVDGKPLKANTKLKQGNCVQIVFPPPTPTELIPEDRPLDVLFEDEHLLVINKPPGVTVHPSPSQMEGTLVHALLHHIQNLSGIGGVLRPGIVHRIDKDTSGALVITKTDLAHQRLAQVFAKHAIERCYWALCYGSPPEQEGKPTQIQSLIGRNPNDRKKMSMQVTRGRKAVTYYQRIQEFAVSGKPPFASWLQLTLETGRTHQIRVHLTGIGHSILGDPVYGTPSQQQPKWKALPEKVKAAVQSLPGQALHARILGFQHPITGAWLRFEATPPEAFEKVLKALQEFC